MSEFHLPESLYGTIPEAVEMHAVGDDEHVLIVNVEGEGKWTDYSAACRLAQSVGIDLEDG